MTKFVLEFSKVHTVGTSEFVQTSGNVVEFFETSGNVVSLFLKQRYARAKIF